MARTILPLDRRINYDLTLVQVKETFCGRCRLTNGCCCAPAPRSHCRLRRPPFLYPNPSSYPSHPDILLAHWTWFLICLICALAPWPGVLAVGALNLYLTQAMAGSGRGAAGPARPAGPAGPGRSKKVPGIKSRKLFSSG